MSGNHKQVNVPGCVHCDKLIFMYAIRYIFTNNQLFIMTDSFVPPLWILCPCEGLRLRIAIEPQLSELISDGQQLTTINRFQRYGNSPANGDYIEGIAAVGANSGLVLGVHRRIYVYWRSPALDPVLNFSRYYTSLLALPIVIGDKGRSLLHPVTLLQTQRFASALDDLT